MDDALGEITYRKGGTIMKSILPILLMLLLPLASLALATEQEPSQFHHLQFKRVSTAPDAAPADRMATARAIIDQVSNLFNSERGLAISNSTSILLLCNQTNPLTDQETPTEFLDNLGVGLKIRF